MYASVRRGLALAAALASVTAASAAHAALIPVLTSITPEGSNFRFTYNVTLAPDAGLVQGSMLALYDFAGYMGGFQTSNPGWVVSTPATSGAPLLAVPGRTDDPTTNLVVTWAGAPLGTSGEHPLMEFTISALSSFGQSVLDGYSGMDVKNSGVAAGTAGFNVGSVAVPIAAVPEPATWAMMILGMGMVGLGLRMRRRQALQPV